MGQCVEAIDAKKIIAEARTVSIVDVYELLGMARMDGAHLAAHIRHRLRTDVGLLPRRKWSGIYCEWADPVDERTRLTVLTAILRRLPAPSRRKGSLDERLLGDTELLSRVSYILGHSIHDREEIHALVADRNTGSIRDRLGVAIRKHVKSMRTCGAPELRSMRTATEARHLHEMRMGYLSMLSAVCPEYYYRQIVAALPASKLTNPTLKKRQED